jgi:hypothetical protein
VGRIDVGRIDQVNSQFTKKQNTPVYCRTLRATRGRRAGVCGGVGCESGDVGMNQVNFEFYKQTKKMRSLQDSCDDTWDDAGVSMEVCNEGSVSQVKYAGQVVQVIQILQKTKYGSLPEQLRRHIRVVQVCVRGIVEV